MAIAPHAAVVERAGATPRVGAALAGAGHAVPDTVVGNAEIARRLGVDEAWIESRTGTRERGALADGERLADLAVRAAGAALRDAGVAAGEIYLVLVGTTSADEMSPHAAPLVAGALGIRGAAAIDISAACTGFLSGLATAAAFIETGRARATLVVGADGLTRYLDPADRGTAMLFGDGAGAVVVTATDAAANDIGPVALHSDPAGSDLIRLGRDDLRIRMDGPVVFRHAVRADGRCHARGGGRRRRRARGHRPLRLPPGQLADHRRGRARTRRRSRARRRRRRPLREHVGRLDPDRAVGGRPGGPAAAGRDRPARGVRRRARVGRDRRDVARVIRRVTPGATPLRATASFAPSSTPPRTRARSSSAGGRDLVREVGRHGRAGGVDPPQGALERCFVVEEPCAGTQDNGPKMEAKLLNGSSVEISTSDVSACVDRHVLSPGSLAGSA
jgi:hypothetical protein